MKFLSVFVSSFVFLFSVFAETNSPSFTKTVTVDVFSKYVDSCGSAYTRGWVAQPSVTVSHESGLYLSVWNSTAFNNRDEEGNELDYTVGWSGDVGPVTADIGVGYYDYYKFFNRTENSWAPFVDISKEFKLKDLGLLITPNFHFEEYIAEPNSSYKSDFYTSAGVEIRKEVYEKIELFCLPAVTYDDGIFYEPCTILSTQLGVDLSISDEMKLKPTTIFYFPLEREDRDNEVVFGVGFEYTF